MNVYASRCRVLFARLHGIFGGTTGAGKSGGLNVLTGNLVACRDVVIWAIDLKKGMELGPWRSCIDRLATSPEEAITLLRDAVAVLEARAALLASAGKRTWEISPSWPALVVIIDEYAELADEAPDAMSDTDSIARLGRNAMGFRHLGGLGGSLGFLILVTVGSFCLGWHAGGRHVVPGDDRFHGPAGGPSEASAVFVLVRRACWPG